MVAGNWRYRMALEPVVFFSNAASLQPVWNTAVASIAPPGDDRVVPRGPRLPGLRVSVSAMLQGVLRDLYKAARRAIMCGREAPCLGGRGRTSARTTRSCRSRQAPSSLPEVKTRLLNDTAGASAGRGTHPFGCTNGRGHSRTDGHTLAHRGPSAPLSWW